MEKIYISMYNIDSIKAVLYPPAGSTGIVVNNHYLVTTDIRDEYNKFMVQHGNIKLDQLECIDIKHLDIIDITEATTDNIPAYIFLKYIMNTYKRIDIEAEQELSEAYSYIAHYTELEGILDEIELRLDSVIAACRPIYYSKPKKTTKPRGKNV